MKKWERIVHFLALTFVVISLFAALFVPSHIPFVLDDVFLPFGAVFVLQVFVKQKKWRLFIALFFAMSAWGMLSDILANGGFRTAPIGMLVRWLKWPIICVTLAELSQLTIKRSWVEKGVVISFFMLAGINVLMMLNPFGIGQAINSLYAPKIDVLLSNYHEFGAFRLSGTMLNPNNNAILFGLFLLFFLHLDPRKYWKHILLAFIFIFLTQSRTALLIIIGIVGVYFLLKNSRKVNLVLIPSAIFMLIVGLFLFRSTNLLSIFDGSAFLSDSFTERIQHFDILCQADFARLIFGHGIILDPVQQVGFHFDSEYLSVSYQYGLIGLLIWVCAIWFLLRISKIFTKQLMFGLLLVIFILGISGTNFIFLNVQCATLLMTLFGAWLFLKRTDELAHNNQK